MIRNRVWINILLFPKGQSNVILPKKQRTLSNIAEGCIWDMNIISMKYNLLDRCKMINPILIHKKCDIVINNRTK